MSWIHDKNREPYFEWLRREVETMKMREVIRHYIGVVESANFWIWHTARGAPEIADKLSEGRDKLYSGVWRIREALDIPIQGGYVDFVALHSLSREPHNWNYNR